VAIAFSLSAVIWVLTAPYWARRADHRGRRALMRLGLYGFIASSLICGVVLAAGLHDLLSATRRLRHLRVRPGDLRRLGLGLARPAVQAYIAARTEGEQRTAYLAALASSFGLGHDHRPRRRARCSSSSRWASRGRWSSSPRSEWPCSSSSSCACRTTLRAAPRAARSSTIRRWAECSSPGAASASPEPAAASGRLRWRDPRVLPWHIIGVVGGHGHAALLGIIGFLVIDRSGVAPAESQQSIAIVLMAGAGATLLAQWGMIPFLALSPRRLVLWGLVIGAAGTALTGFAGTMYGMTLGFSIASVGFGLFRPRLHQRRLSRSPPGRAECGGGDGHLGQRSRLHRRARFGGAALRGVDAAAVPDDGRAPDPACDLGMGAGEGLSQRSQSLRIGVGISL
jgi:hypothetical protein